MSKYLRLQATAGRLIKENGSEFQIRKKVDPIKDPVNGTVTTASYDATPADCVVLLPGQIKSLPVEQFTGQNLLQLSKLNNLLISAVGLKWPLAPLMEIYYEESWWLLEFLSPLKPDGKTVVLYKAFMRRK